MTAAQDLPFPAGSVVMKLRASPRIGLWLDTSEQTPEETVDELWRRAVEAQVA